MNIQAVSKLVTDSPDLQARMASDPVGTLQTLSAGAPLATDKVIYRVIIGGMTFSLIAAVIGAEILTAYSRPVPESVVALGSAALGAMALLLRPQSDKSL